MVLLQQLLSVAEANLVDMITWVESSTSLPKPLSDMTATYMMGKGGTNANGFIVLFGGCDSPSGNQRNKSISLTQFYCLSVTNSTFLYDPYQNTVTKMKDAPHPRYRHVAVSFNDEIYMLGGRDLDDNIVTAIDVSSTKLQLLSPEENFLTLRNNNVLYFIPTFFFHFRHTTHTVIVGSHGDTFLVKPLHPMLQDGQLTTIFFMLEDTIPTILPRVIHSD